MADLENIGTIQLTRQEAAICEALNFDQGAFVGDYPTGQRNGHLACQLMHLLLARSAIPAQRLAYFDDPTYRHGRIKGSRRKLFERNGTADDEIYRHPNFLEHLRYFLFGASLPNSVIERFSEAAGRFGHVGPSDALELGKLARDLTRQFGLQPHEASDEFFKLALDCGIYHGHAERIANSVRNIR